MGVGNVLLGDEGVGVHAVRRLEAEGDRPGVTWLDGGTGGFHLLGVLQEHDPVILIDACLDDGPPGRVRVLTPRFASEFPRSLSAHDIGLRDLIESASLLGPLPRIHLVAVSIDPAQPLSLDLSPVVAHALPEVLERVREILRRIESLP